MSTPTPATTAPMKVLSNLVSTLLLMAALRVWPRLAASASTPLTITEALALEERFRAVIQALRLGKVPDELAKSLALRDRAGYFFFLTGMDGTTSANYRRKARQGAARFLDPASALAMGLCLRVAESRGGRGLLAWLALADKLAKLLGYAGFHAVAAGGKGWRPRKLSRLAGERGLSLEDLLAGRLAAPGDGEEDGDMATQVEAVSLEDLRPLIDKVRSMQKAYKAGMAFAVASGMAATTPEAAAEQAKAPQTEALSADSAEGVPPLADRATVLSESAQAGDEIVPEAGGGDAPVGDSTDLADGAPALAEATQVEEVAVPEAGGSAGSTEDGTALADEATLLAEGAQVGDGTEPEAGGSAGSTEDGPALADEALELPEGAQVGDGTEPEAGGVTVQTEKDGPNKNGHTETPELLESAGDLCVHSCQVPLRTGGASAPHKHDSKNGRKKGRKRRAR